MLKNNKLTQIAPTSEVTSKYLWKPCDNLLMTSHMMGFIIITVTEFIMVMMIQIIGDRKQLASEVQSKGP